MNLATAVLEIIENCLREEERRDAWLMFVEASEQAFIQYEVRRERELARLARPSRN
jgi:hypothetical protein